MIHHVCFHSTIVTSFDVPGRGTSRGPSSVDEVTLELPRGERRGLDRAAEVPSYLACLPGRWIWERKLLHVARAPTSLSLR